MIKIVKGSSVQEVDETLFPLLREDLFNDQVRIHETDVFVNRRSNGNVYTQISPRIINGRVTTSYKIVLNHKALTISFDKVKELFNEKTISIDIFWGDRIIDTISIEKLCQKLNCSLDTLQEKIEEFNAQNLSIKFSINN